MGRMTFMKAMVIGPGRPRSATPMEAPAYHEASAIKIAQLTFAPEQ
jgi:hypothetical protein